MKRRGERERRRKDPGCWVSRIGGWPCYGWLLSSGSGRKPEANLLLPESILLLVLRKCWNLSPFFFFHLKKGMLTFPVFTFPSISSGQFSFTSVQELSPLTALSLTLTLPSFLLLLITFSLFNPLIVHPHMNIYSHYQNKKDPSFSTTWVAVNTQDDLSS